MDDLSLIWDKKDEKITFTNKNFIKDIGIDKFITIDYKNTLWKQVINIENFFTVNINTIIRRNELFNELLKNRELYKILIELIPKIQLLGELKIQKELPSDIESSLYSIKEIEIFVDIVNLLFDSLSLATFSSEALKDLKYFIDELYKKDDFIQLKTETAKLSVKVCNTKSITIGLNLDAQFRPIEAGVMSINDEYIKAGNIIDKLLNTEKYNNPMRCLTVLSPMKKDVNNSESLAINFAFLNALNKIFAAPIRSFRPVIKKYVAINSKFLHDIFDELLFIQAVMEVLITLNDCNLPLCPANITDESDKIVGLYNPKFSTSDGSSNNIVFNDLTFDDTANIYVLTGPNQGGKSVFTYAVGFAYAMLHLGILIPAKEANMSLVDGIYTHFPKVDEIEIGKGKGRFGEECAYISGLSKRLTKKSLFLFDEAFSSTSGLEAAYISEDLLSAYIVIGVKGIFSTHLHELANKIDKINSVKNSKSKLDYLCAVIDPTTNTRKYLIKRQQPDGSSYAKDIALKYGLTCNDIIKSNDSLNTI